MHAFTISHSDFMLLFKLFFVCSCKAMTWVWRTEMQQMTR